MSIQSKPSIVQAIGQRFELRKSGNEHIGLCPFHADKAPSFHVNEDKGVFHCFGCGESGDVFDFIMKLDGVAFTDAVKSLGITPNNSFQRPQLAEKPSSSQTGATLSLPKHSQFCGRSASGCSWRKI